MIFFPALHSNCKNFYVTEELSFPLIFSPEDQWEVPSVGTVLPVEHHVSKSCAGWLAVALLC